jgi:predicted nuclease with TOPRIM domain
MQSDLQRAQSLVHSSQDSNLESRLKDDMQRLQKDNQNLQKENQTLSKNVESQKSELQKLKTMQTKSEAELLSLKNANESSSNTVKQLQSQVCLEHFALAILNLWVFNHSFYCFLS